MTAEVKKLKSEGWIEYTNSVISQGPPPVCLYKVEGAIVRFKMIARTNRRPKKGTTFTLPIK